MGVDHVRLRLVGARIAFPDWLAGKDGFQDQRTLVGALLVALRSPRSWARPAGALT